MIETAPSLSTAGGVLTPKGQIVLDPSIEYDYWSQNQLGVNGFQIIPGITFGNIFANRVEQNITTAALTGRYGITDKWEVNIKVPYVYNTGNTISLIPVGTTAELLSVNATGTGIGDIQFGTSYQFNSGENGWPIFVGNLLFKTATGISPFDVPIITVNDPNGNFLEGQPKKLATGTGFFAAEPSLTVLLPTAPGVLFANLQDIHNLGRTVNVQVSKAAPGRRLCCSPAKTRHDLWHRLFAKRPRGADLQLPASTRFHRILQSPSNLRARRIHSAPSISALATRISQSPG